MGKVEKNLGGRPRHQKNESAKLAEMCRAFSANKLKTTRLIEAMSLFASESGFGEFVNPPSSPMMCRWLGKSDDHPPKDSSVNWMYAAWTWQREKLASAHSEPNE